MMSNIAPSAARQALRVCSRRYPSSSLSRFAPRTAATGHHGRSYVTETKPVNATINVDTTIKAEREAFMKETGSSPAHETMPTTGLRADAMMSPTAGMYIVSVEN